MMRNRMRNLGQNLTALIMNLVIICLCIVLVISGILAIGGLRDAFSPSNTENSMYYRLDSGDFYRMVDGYHTNSQEGYEGSKDMQEYYGVAKYYEAASMYRAFLETGDLERADRELEKMKKARVQMGEWMMTEPEILEQLQLDGQLLPD